MQSAMTLRRVLKWSIATLVIVFAAIALLAATLALTDGHQLRAPLTGYLSRHTGREFRIDGNLEIHLLSLHPSITASQVTIGNPRWSPAGTMARISKLAIVFDLPWAGRPFAVRQLALDGADIHLQRDAEGHASWLWKPPGILPGKDIPIIYSLSMPNAHLTLDDDRRHLLFDGTLTTSNAPSNEPLRIDGKGHLNSRDATFALRGDPLATISRDKPYAFSLDARSSGSHLTGHGSVKHPLDFRELDGVFEASGLDLKDLFFLAGVRLPNTGPYHLSGKLARHDTRFELNDLVATSGESDVHATVTSQMDRNGHTHVDVDLRSRRLRISDLGLQAAGRAAVPQDEKPLFPEWEIRTDGIRHGDVQLSFHAHELDVGRATFHAVAARMSVAQGIANIPTLTATIPDGKISAHIKFDAKPDIPKATLEATFSDLRLGQFSKTPQQPPIDGLLQGHLNLTGQGRSVHELVADANGTVTMTLPEGSLRKSLAELIGFDLRALGLMLTKNKEDTPIRCGIARFQAHRGMLTANTLIVDTDRMVITGGGSIQLGTEHMDLELQGQPKHVRLLRLQAPVNVHGTIKHPAFAADKDDRKFKLVDPGHGKDVDCGALLAHANADEGLRKSAPAGPGPERR